MAPNTKKALKWAAAFLGGVFLGVAAYLFWIDRKGEKMRQETDNQPGADRWPNFKFSEFDSPAMAGQVVDPNVDTYQRGAKFYLAGSGEANMDRDFLDMLQEARTIAGVPFTINSGYRTPEYNATLPDSVSDSAHIFGKAADIRTTSENYMTIARALATAGFRRLGFGRTYIHADNDQAKPQVTWNYSGATKYTIDQLLT